MCQNWQTSEGLPHNSPTCALQDGDGFLWIGTHSGVARFDGSRFENFRARDGLTDNRVLAMRAAPDGRLWVGTQRGAIVRDGGDWSPPSVGLPAEPIWSIERAADGALWFGTGRGVWRLWDGKLLHVAEGLPHPEIRALLADPAGAMWILSRGGLCRWDQGRLERITAPDDTARGRQFWDLQRDAGGDLILAGDGFLMKGGGTKWADLSVGMPAAEGIHVHCTVAQDGSLWVATRNRGVARLGPEGWDFFDVGDGLSHDDVRHLCEDREGNIWVSTNGGGINRLKRSPLTHYGVGSGLGRHLTSAIVAGPDGTLRAGTDGGGVMRLENGTFVPDISPQVLRDPFVWSLCHSRDGTIWVGLFSEGVVGWKNGAVRRLRMETGLADTWITSLTEDDDGGLWIGAHNGAVQLWKDGALRTLRRGSPSHPSAVVSLLHSRDGAVWAASEWGGVMRFSDGKCEEIGVDGGLPTLSMTTLHEDAGGRMWLGTANSGLLMREGNGFLRWDMRHGLASNTVNQILSDGAGNLWLGSDNGLQRVAVDELLAVAAGSKPRMGRGALFSRSEGLATPQCVGGHGNLCVRDASGDLWFSLVSGVVKAPRDLPENKSPTLRTFVESVVVGGTECWNRDHPGHGSVLRVRSPAAPVDFRFTAPALASPERTRLRYRLIGVDKTWRDAGSTRTATYSSLPHGDYRFEVEAVYPGEDWDAAGSASLGVNIVPRIWETAVVRAVSLLGAVAAVAAVVRWRALARMRRRLAALEQERKLEAERSRIARDLHDDLGATLTEINFLGTLGAAAAQSPATRDRLEGIVERAQRMAKSLDEIVWTVNPDNDTLSSTVNYLCSRAQESLHAAGIRFRLDAADHLPVTPLDSEIRHHLLMAVNETVNNVMKHAGAGEVNLTIRAGVSELELTVADDGRGFDPDHVPPERNGLRNLRARLSQIGGRVRVDSAPGQGTRIRMVLPLAQPKTPPGRVGASAGVAS